MTEHYDQREALYEVNRAIEEAVPHQMAAGNKGALIRGESFAVSIPALAPEPVEVPSAFATLWAWAHLYRRRLYASDRSNLWAAWRQWVATKPDKNRNWFMLLPIEARQAIMERQADEYMASSGMADDEEIPGLAAAQRNAVQGVLEAVATFYNVPVSKVSPELVEGFVRDVETRAKVAAAGEIAEGA